MNKKYCGDNEVDSGIDLNRNYGFEYGQTREDVDECSETFRGEIAFSEPETKAIKNLIKKNPTIISAMNFHTYGNMWIHPFNYMTEVGKYPRNLPSKFVDFYENFGKMVKTVSPNAKYGNAIEMVSYNTYGEASDWMLGEKGIVAFSPELGSEKEDTDTFFMPRDLIFEVIEENYKIINLFLQRTVFNINNVVVGINNKDSLFIKFLNSGLTTLYDAILVIESPQKDILKSINEITSQNQSINQK